MIIIHSASYVSPELQTEFGAIPPCMLPLANRKLIEHQVRALGAAFPEQAIIVSLPACYALTVHETDLLATLGVSIVHTPEGASECASLAAILGPKENEDRSVRIQLGCTLLQSYAQDFDMISLGYRRGERKGEKEPAAGFENQVYAGFFAFSSSRELARCLARGKETLSDAISLYAKGRRMKFVPVEQWFDLSRINGYFRSRAALTTQRAFNSLHVEGNVITKTGTPFHKIAAEAEWFRQAPPEIKKYIPQLLSSGLKDGQPYYQLEYLPLSPLNELFVHGRNPVAFWEYAFDLIENFIRDAAITVPDEEAVRQAAHRLYGDKTRARLRLFTEAEGIDAEKPLYYAGARLPSLQDICEDCLQKTLLLPGAPGILHGDLCLSNILVDQRARIIKVVDPRGLDNDNTQTIYGDQKYDVAKLAHSCIGLYDYIISGYYRLWTEDPHHYDLRIFIDDRLASVQAAFWSRRFVPQCSIADVMPLTVLLFLSMLPLHSENHGKQQALFANALRLYQEYVTGKAAISCRSSATEQCHERTM